MIIGVLGKGGSGKSTISTNLVLFLSKQLNTKVLAIDADHNMDLTYNLGVENSFAYLGSAMADLKKFTGIEQEDNYRKALLANEQGIFNIYPKDAFTEKYTHTINSNISLMAAGPQTDDVLNDKSCSHILFTPLKVYLPLLHLNEGEWVIVDEKAGADGVSTGIPTGFDVALVSVESTPHGIKAARQIAMLLEHYKVPFEFIINKFSSKYNREDIESVLGKQALAVIPFEQNVSEFDDIDMSEIVDKLIQNRQSYEGQRFERSKIKFESWK